MKANLFNKQHLCACMKINYFARTKREMAGKEVRERASKQQVCQVEQINEMTNKSARTKDYFVTFRKLTAIDLQQFLLLLLSSLYSDNTAE